jgi:hypothetical protein
MKKLETQRIILRISISPSEFRENEDIGCEGGEGEVEGGGGADKTFSLQWSNITTSRCEPWQKDMGRVHCNLWSTQK